MGHAIHRNGDRYRVWSTFVDRYLTPPMTREEMAVWVREEALAALMERVDDDTENRLARADKCGSSGFRRDSTKWDTELCHCGWFHHKFELGPSDGKCGHCGEPGDNKAHEPQCE